jgi:hypothetical protein
MSDDLDHYEHDWQAGAEWGLASLVLGCVLAFLGPIGLVLTFAMESSHFWAWPRDQRLFAGVGGYLAAVLLLALAVAGIGFGVRSMRAARRVRQPVARGLVGVMLNAFDLFVVLGAGVGWHGTVWRFL